MVHCAFGRHHGFRQVTPARGGGEYEGRVGDSLLRRGKDARMVQNAAGGTRCHRHGAGVGPAVARIDKAHPGQAEVQHRPGGRADVLAHLRADKDEDGLV